MVPTSWVGTCVPKVPLVLLRGGCPEEQAGNMIMASFLGLAQWFDLLRRPKLSIFSDVYDFARAADDWRSSVVPSSVLVEVVMDSDMRVS